VTTGRRIGKYGSYAELSRREVLGMDYRVIAKTRPHSPVLIIAPHGGMIEVGTSEIARQIAGSDYSLFSFEGLKPYGTNRDLHITSHQFDHPDCLAVAARCAIVLAVHGCAGESEIHLGGLDQELAARLASALRCAGFPVDAASRKYPGRHPHNICNRGLRGRGAQLELTHDLRTGGAQAEIARAVRSAIAAHAGQVAPPPSAAQAAGLSR
jgi:phage replication-related protein YjqB (UPF0714/DUF867 family)